MSAALATRALRRGGRNRPSTTPEVTVALAPVVRSLIASARSRADKVVSRAEADAREAQASAQREADRLVERATAEAIESEERAAASRLADARQESFEIVLSARRKVYDALCDAAIQELGARSDDSEGRLLALRMEQLVAERVGIGATVLQSTDDGRVLSVVAESANRRARLDARSLIDTVLQSMPAEIEQLWR